MGNAPVCKSEDWRSEASTRVNVKWIKGDGRSLGTLHS